MDALLVNDEPPVLPELLPFVYNLAAEPNEIYRGAAGPDLNLIEIGTGWENIPTNTLSEYAEVQHSQSARRTRGSGNSFQFTLPGATTYTRL